MTSPCPQCGYVEGIKIWAKCDRHGWLICEGVVMDECIVVRLCPLTIRCRVCDVNLIVDTEAKL
jgi:hypothetical protein